MDNCHIFDNLPVHRRQPVGRFLPDCGAFQPAVERRLRLEPLIPRFQQLQAADFPVKPFPYTAKGVVVIAVAADRAVFPDGAPALPYGRRAVLHLGQRVWNSSR